MSRLLFLTLNSVEYLYLFFEGLMTLLPVPTAIWFI